jgi:hypothetical protein
MCRHLRDEGDQRQEEVSRRRLLAGLLLSLAAPLAAEAQPAGKVYRIGYLGISPEIGVEAFRQGLRELGRVEGQNITIEYRWAGGKSERLPELVAELLAVDISALRALAPLPRAPVPRPSRPQPACRIPAGAAGTAMGGIRRSGGTSLRDDRLRVGLDDVHLGLHVDFLGPAGSDRAVHGPGTHLYVAVGRDGLVVRWISGCHRRIPE